MFLPDFESSKGKIDLYPYLQTGYLSSGLLGGLLGGRSFGLGGSGRISVGFRWVWEGGRKNGTKGTYIAPT